MKKEWNIFLTALMFYTRIPPIYKLDHEQDNLIQSGRYLPLIGWIVGGVSAGVFVASRLVFSVEISVVLSMISTLLLTGAFHEDGLADTADAFGGGWDKEKILSIMKDSQIGSYGAVVLACGLLLKFIVLVEVLSFEKSISFSTILWVFAVLVSGHSVSRFMAIVATAKNQYVRENDSKSKLAVEQNVGWFSPLILISAIFGLAPLVAFKTPFVLWLIVVPFMAQFFMKRFFKKWIGGYTGDCLGAIQQVSEVVFYLSLLGLWRFI